MRRAGASVAVLLAALVSLLACATRPASSPRADVEATFQRYCALLRVMDHSAIAAMFSADGEIVNTGEAPVRGAAMINAYLAGFADYKILSYTTGPLVTNVDGDYARLQTVYHETVRIPDGRVITASGQLEALWRRSSKGRWYLTRVATVSL